MDEPPSYTSLLLVISGTSLTYVLGFAALLFLLISGWVSASEAVFFYQGNNGVTRSPDKGVDKALAGVLKDPRLLLATIRIVRNASNISLITLCVFLVWIAAGTQRPDGWITAGMVAAATLAIVAFGGLIPRVVARKNYEILVRRAAPFWRFTMAICRPLSKALNGIDRITEHQIEKQGYYQPPELEQSSHPEETGWAVNGSEQDILKGITSFAVLTVRQVMRSRIDISAVNVEMNFHELMDYINKSGYSRMPAFRETIDHIEGILYIKDLLPYTEQDENFKWQELLRPSFFVPENKKIDSLLKDFQEKRIHIALVVDEYGGILGLITLEDIIEEVIGEINDEFDEEVQDFKKIDESTYVFEGKTLLHDLCKTLDVDGTTFDSIRGESESLGGLILELTNDLPNVGRKIDFKPFTFTIEAVDKRRIKRVRVHIHEHEES